MFPYFKDKVVAITGGSDGIGKALVELLIESGARVATCGRNFDKLYELQMRHSDVMLHTIVCDVSNEQDCRRFVDSTIKTFGGIDILINNAGLSMRGLFHESDVEVTRKLMEVNFFGSVYCTRFALDSIIERKGMVIGISSVAGYRGLPGRSAYSASKAALQMFLETLRVELKDAGVHVMWVCPGFTASNIRFTALKADGTPTGTSVMDEGKMMSAAECAAHILRAAEKKKRSVVLTFQEKQTVFLNRFFPALADKLVHKFYYKDGKLVK